MGDYKQFLSEAENTTLQTKLEKLKIGSKKYFLSAKYFLLPTCNQPGVRTFGKNKSTVLFEEKESKRERLCYFIFLKLNPNISSPPPPLAILLLILISLVGRSVR